MKKLSLVFLLVTLMTSSVFATSFIWDTNQVGNWNEPNKWLDPNSNPAGSAPDGTGQIQIRHTGSKCTLDANSGDWADPQRLRVYAGATLNVVDKANLLGISWLRVGTADGPGTLNQTGGLIRLKRGSDNTKLHVGDAKGSKGSVYTISGGTLTYTDGDGSLWAGYRGGEGKITVVGTKPKIDIRKLYIGGDLSPKAATGILEFKITSDGVSPIKASNNVYLDRDRKGSTANLIVTATAAPPKANIVLIEDTGGGRIEGSFDTVNDKPAQEDAPVVLTYGETNYNYKLTYRYNASGDNNNNDVALIYVSETPKSPDKAPIADPNN